jgi:hypothetical protein
MPRLPRLFDDRRANALTAAGDKKTHKKLVSWRVRELES